MSSIRHSSQRRWLLIQLHRAQIAHLQRSGRHDVGSEIADRMNAIARLCDCGRTEHGRALAALLAQSERDSTEPVLAELLPSYPVELASWAPSSPAQH